MPMQSAWDVYRTRLPGHWVALCGAPDGLVQPRGPHVERAAMAVLLDQPLGVVAGGEGTDSVTDLVDGLEDAAVHELLFQTAEQALDDAVRLGFCDEGVARGHAPEPDLLLAVGGHKVAAVIVAERDASGGVGRELAELLADGHAEGLCSFEAGARLRHVPAEELGVPVFGDAEQPDLAVLDGGDLGRVGGPHDVRRLSDDVAVVRCLGPLVGAVRRQQSVLAHQAQDALAGDADAVTHAQAGPDLAVAFAGPGGTGEVLADGGEQRPVGARGLWPAARRQTRQGAGRHRLAGGVEAGARHAPGLADALDAVALAAGGGGGVCRPGRPPRPPRA